MASHETNFNFSLISMKRIQMLLVKTEMRSEELARALSLKAQQKTEKKFCKIYKFDR